MCNKQSNLIFEKKNCILMCCIRTRLLLTRETSFRVSDMNTKVLQYNVFDVNGKHFLLSIWKDSKCIRVEIKMNFKKINKKVVDPWRVAFNCCNKKHEKVPHIIIIIRRRCRNEMLLLYVGWMRRKYDKTWHCESSSYSFINF